MQVEVPRDSKVLGFLVQLDNPLMFELDSYSIVSRERSPRRFLTNLIINLSQGQITYQLIIGLLLLSSTPSTRDALGPKNLTSPLITDNFYTSRLIRLIHLRLIFYSLLRSRREPLTTLIFSIYQHVRKINYESKEAQSHETIE